MRKNPTNRYIEDTIARIGTIVRYTGQFEQYVALYDNFYSRTRLTDIYEPDKTYLMGEFTCLWIQQGKVSITINGKSQTMERKSIVIIPMQASFKVQQVTPETRFAFVRYSKTAIIQSIKDVELYMNRFSPGRFDVTELSNEAFKEISGLYDEFCEGLSHKELKYLDIYARSFCNLILVFLLNSFSIDTHIKGKAISRQETVYRQFIDLLNLYAHREREVQFYADQLHISPKYLSTVTQTYSGKNASEWIAEYVVGLAIEMMREKRCKIQDVSANLNFPTQSFFGRYFKRTTGLSPTQYAQKYFEKD
ncbi:MAG: helix-turn-helix domain-containing protein [Bacteroidaceae bacterium]|nr:helix-turn-helix domain-containing protein [Bacteroidaceae bacterium]